MIPRQPVQPPLIDVPDTPPDAALIRMSLRALVVRPGQDLLEPDLLAAAWGVGLSVVHDRRRPVAAEPKDAA